jgi:SOS-response transcriptional repressor LexA
MSVSVIRNILEGKSRSPRYDTVARLASALETTVEWLEHGEGPETVDQQERFAEQEAMLFPRVGRATVAGTVAAGLWIDDGDWDGFGHGGEAAIEIPVVLGRYSKLEQCAYRVLGDSMDRAGILEGGYVVAVEYWAVRDGIVDGDLVVVVRRESLRTERTVKRVRVEPRAYVLEPMSTNPKHQPIEMPRGAGPADDRCIEIAGLVIGYYRPL